MPSIVLSDRYRQLHSYMLAPHEASEVQHNAGAFGQQEASQGGKKSDGQDRLARAKTHQVS